MCSSLYSEEREMRRHFSRKRIPCVYDPLWIAEKNYLKDKYESYLKNPYVSSMEHVKHCIELWQPTIRELVEDYFAQCNPVNRKVIHTCLYEYILQPLENEIGATAVIMLLLSTITTHVFREAPDQQLRHEGHEFIYKAASACSQLGEICLSYKCLALLKIGLYALDIYGAYSSKGRQVSEFRQHVVTQTRTLLKECAQIIIERLLSAIVGYFIGGWLGDWAQPVVRGIISIAAYIIKKGIKWLRGKTDEQIMSDMKKETESSWTGSLLSLFTGQVNEQSIVHFDSIDTDGV